MSIERVITTRLKCDGRNCRACFHGTGTSMVVRRAAAADGWWHGVRRVGNAPSLTFDFCPEHHDRADVVRAVRVELGVVG